MMRSVNYSRRRKGSAVLGESLIGLILYSIPVLDGEDFPVNTHMSGQIRRLVGVGCCLLQLCD